MYWFNFIVLGGEYYLVFFIMQFGLAFFCEGLKVCGVGSVMLVFEFMGYFLKGIQLDLVFLSVICCSDLLVLGFFGFDLVY